MLYGEGGLYPEPYLAGKIPGNLFHAREKERKESLKSFQYSVRFRAGPIGVAFDNTITNATVVNSVMPNMQAHLSDIQLGDRLIAINEHNTTLAPPKICLKMLQTLPWPMVLVFETAPPTAPALTQQIQSALSRTFNASVIYPPTVTGDFTGRLADWTPALDLVNKDVCPIFYIRAPRGEQFGCDTSTEEYSVPSYIEEIVSKNGEVSIDMEKASPMTVLMVKEAKKRNIVLKPKSLGLVKRGICTFPHKSRQFARGQADVGLIVNTEDIVIDIPLGKEDAKLSTTPTGLIKQSDGELLQITAMQSEVLVLLSDPILGLSEACQQVLNMAETLIDKWAHSVPHVTSSTVLSYPLPTKKDARGKTDEGGRLAVSGSNGWAFFDYHLALFGPPQVPIGPFRLQMASPPFGCDPNAYTVRITGTVVAILRGGGCSFGIKMINAQKLGAVAVIIVNTDDKKTMRLMALPDEESLITIPCIMVSRRIQYYLEQQLRYYHPIDQHIVSIQPTGLFGKYEERNVLTLPTRLN